GKSSAKKDSKFLELEKNLADTLKTPVLIHSTEKGGKIVIRFATLQDLNKIAKSIID
ncbi:MAG: chromosome partitioning protein ParB, partial [Candidatus Yanofskybacteria bacterium]|nr:chromosome partitioning protein ParB [Candidatus Yanofskybacteria bacterium]